MQKKTLRLVVTALTIAIYIVLSLVSGAFNLAAGPIQFRLSESLNHLVAFNRRYLLGVVLGVVLFNALFSPMGWVDVLFGGGQTLLALGLVSWLSPHFSKLWQRMGLVTIAMTLTMLLIAVEIVWTSHLPIAALWPTYAGLMLSETAILLVSAPVMIAVDRVVHFAQRMD